MYYLCCLVLLLLGWKKPAGWKVPKDYVDENDMVREDGIKIDGVELDKCSLRKGAVAASKEV